MLRQVSMFELKNKLDLYNLLKELDSDDDIKLSVIVQRFPFTQLVELPGLDYENINSICLILLRFIAINKLEVENVRYIVSFLTRYLNFLKRQYEYNENTLSLLLELLRQILERFCFPTCNQEIFWGLIDFNPDPVKEIRNKILTCRALIAISLLKQLGDTIDESIFIDSIKTVVESTWEINRVLCLQVINQVFRTFKKSFVPEIRSFYKFIEDNISLRLEEPELFKEEILAACEVYEICNKSEITDKLSKKLLSKITVLFKALKQLKQFTQPLSKIIEELIIFEFPNLPWMGKLQQDLFMFVNSGHEFHEIQFIQYYLEFIYNSHNHNKSLIQVSLTRVYSQQKPPTNPPVMKAVYLLFAAYMAYECTKKAKIIGNILLRSLHRQDNLSYYITFHKSQFMWILVKAPRALKEKVLHLWIINDKVNTPIIYKCIKTFRGTEILVELIVKAEEVEILNKISDILKEFHSEHLSDLLMNTMPRVIYKPEVIEYLLKGKPSVPKDPKLAVVIASELTLSINKIQTPNGVLDVCKYCAKLLSTHKNDEKILSFYLSKHFLSSLISRLSAKHTEFLIPGIVLITKIINYQIQKKIPVTQFITFDSSRFLHTPCLLYGLKLVRILLRHSKADTAIRLENPSLDLYLKLLSLRQSPHEGEIYGVLTRLLKLQNHLSFSIHNIFYVECVCKERPINKDFLIFLKCWLDLRCKLNPYLLPINAIRKYLHDAKQQYPDVVPDITNILNKCQQKQPTTSLTSHTNVMDRRFGRF